MGRVRRFDPRQNTDTGTFFATSSWSVAGRLAPLDLRVFQFSIDGAVVEKVAELFIL